jgi:Abortive infection C-terminus
MNLDWYPGIRAFTAHWRHAPMLQQTFETLEREFNDDNDACIDAAKGFVECACRLLVQELDDPLNPIATWPDSPLKSNPSTTNYVTAALRLLEITEQRHDPFSRIISKHHDLATAIAKFRDIAGTISHGKDGLSKKLSAHHRRSAILAADALVTFLHEAYLEREPDPVKTFEPYERFEAPNALIDATVTMKADVDDNGYLASITVYLPEREELALTFEPSRLLFGVDREAYKITLAACREATKKIPARNQDAA